MTPFDDPRLRDYARRAGYMGDEADAVPSHPARTGSPHTRDAFEAPKRAPFYRMEDDPNSHAFNRPEAPFTRVNPETGKEEEHESWIEPYTTADITGPRMQATMAREKDFQPPFPETAWGAKLDDVTLGDKFGIIPTIVSRLAPWMADPEHEEKAKGVSWSQAARNSLKSIDPIANIGNMLSMGGAGLKHGSTGAAMVGALAPSAAAGYASVAAPGLAKSVAKDMGGQGTLRSLASPDMIDRLGRPKGSWGSLEALDAAKRAAKHPDDPDRTGAISPDELWKRYGWSNNLYDEHVPWYSAIDDSAMKPTDQWGASYKNLGDHIEHPELQKAIPSLFDKPTSITSGSEVDRAFGATTSERLPRGGSWTAEQRKEPYRFEASAPTRKQALSVLLHEMQHGISTSTGNHIPQGANPNSAGMRFDTPNAERAKLKSDFAQMDPGADAAYRSDALNEADNAARFSAYWNQIGEKAARGEQVIFDNKMPLETPRQHRYVDIYNQSRAFGPDYDKRGEIPFSLYDELNGGKTDINY